MKMNHVVQFGSYLQSNTTQIYNSGLKFEIPTKKRLKFEIPTKKV
jgi:hypothetical protein